MKILQLILTPLQTITPQVQVKTSVYLTLNAIIAKLDSYVANFSSIEIE